MSFYIGQRVGYLTIIGDFFTPTGSNKKSVPVKCECGKEVVIRKKRLYGLFPTCGCDRGLAIVKHGHIKSNGMTKEYKSWSGMKTRCYRVNGSDYHDYGGRGITVCERWRNDYSKFLEDMGYAPTKAHSIDRIDVNGNYEPGNCKWSTPIEQANNRRSNVLCEINGVVKNLKQWATELGCSVSYINNRRIRLGETVNEIAERLGYNPDSPGASNSNVYKRDLPLYEYNGQEQSLKEWAIALGVSYNTLYGQIRQYGKNLADVISERGYKVTT